jgi:hypothetical protein
MNQITERQIVNGIPSQQVNPRMIGIQMTNDRGGISYLIGSRLSNDTERGDLHELTKCQFLPLLVTEMRWTSSFKGLVSHSGCGTCPSNRIVLVNDLGSLDCIQLRDGFVTQRAANLNTASLSPVVNDLDIRTVMPCVKGAGLPLSGARIQERSEERFQISIHPLPGRDERLAKNPEFFAFE